MIRNVFIGIAVVFLLLGGIAGITWQLILVGKAQAIAAHERARAAQAEKLAIKATQDAQQASIREAEQRSKAEEFHYQSHMQLAATRIKAGLPGMAQDALAATAERLRGFEYEYLSALSDQSLLCLRGHNGPLTSAQYNPEGTRILTASADHTARIWDATSGQELMQLVGHSGPITTAIFIGNGKQVLTASEDLTARFWDLDTGRELRQLKGHSKPIRFAFQSPDGELIFTASDDSIRIWTSSDGAERQSLSFTPSKEAPRKSDYNHWKSAQPEKSDSPPEPGTVLPDPIDANDPVEIDAILQSITLSSDGRRLFAVFGYDTIWDPRRNNLIPAIISDDGSVHVWDVATGQELFRTPTLPEHDFTGIMSADGRLVATHLSLIGQGAEATHSVWDVETGKELAHSTQTGYGLPMAFSSDGETLLCRQFVLQSSTLAPTAELDGQKEAMSFSPDSRYVIGEYGALWDGHNGKVIEGMNAVYSGRGSLSVKSTVVWSRSGRAVAVIIGNGICLGTLPGAEFPDAEQGFLRPDFMPKEAAQEPLALPAILVSRHDESTHVQVQNKVVFSYTAQGHTDSVTAIAMSPDDRFLVSASHDGTARVWSMSTGSQDLLLEGVAKYTSSAFQFSQSRIWEVLDTWHSSANTLGAWPQDSGRRLCFLHPSPGQATESQFLQIAPAPDGERIAVLLKDVGPKMLILDHERLRAAWALDLAILPVFHVNWSPDGRRLAMLVGRDPYAYAGTEVTLRRADNGEEIQRIQHPDVYDAVVSHNGERICTLGTDDTKVWDIASGRELFALTWAAEGSLDRHVCFSPHDTYLCTVDRKGKGIMLWDGKQEFQFPDARFPAAFTADEARLVTALEGGGAAVWDVLTCTEQVRLGGRHQNSFVEKIAVSPDGNRIATTMLQSTTLQVWDAKSGIELLTVPDVSSGHYARVEFTADNKRILAGRHILGNSRKALLGSKLLADSLVLTQERSVFDPTQYSDMIVDVGRDLQVTAEATLPVLPADANLSPEQKMVADWNLRIDILRASNALQWLIHQRQWNALTEATAENPWLLKLLAAELEIRSRNQNEVDRQARAITAMLMLGAADSTVIFKPTVSPDCGRILLQLSAEIQFPLGKIVSGIQTDAPPLQLAFLLRLAARSSPAALSPDEMATLRSSVDALAKTIDQPDVASAAKLLQTKWWGLIQEPDVR